MLSLSVHEAARRTTWTCIACSALSRTPQGLITCLPLSRSASKHYRKHSSSKASSSAKDETRPISSASESPNNDQATVGKRSASRFGRRSSKDISKISGKSKNEFQDLPSVPSTQHLHPLDIHVASFFSNHRPISVTTSFPPASSEVAFSSMFTPQTSSRQKPSDIIYTISSAVDSLENATALRQQPNSEEAELRSVLSETELPDPHPDHKLLDASSQQQNVHIDVQELIKTFRPFVAPPAPVPMERDQASAPQEYPHSTSYRGKSPRATQKSYSAVLTILEQTHPDGRKVWKARTGPFREDPLPQPTNPENSDNSVIEIAPTPRHPFIDRMRIRRRAWQERMMKRNEAVWRAISVKRQRKLKMKKHKYKKLMRKTRNLRRRLDKN